jgi:uncharacterized membrane protein YfcA
MNALKNVLIAVVNLVAGIVFVIVAQVARLAVLLLAAGSLVGGQLGATIGRRLPPLGATLDHCGGRAGRDRKLLLFWNIGSVSLR